MKIEDLKANPENPRYVSDEKLEMLKKSILEFGDLSPIIFNRTTETLSGGHQRVKVIPENAQVIITKTYDKPTRTGTVAEGFILIDGEQFSYREVKWDKLKEKAANIAANKGAGEWEFKKLTEWLHELDANNFDLNLTMFDQAELDRLLGGWDSDIEAMSNVKENLDGIEQKITISCRQDDKDELLIFLKGKLLESSFEGVHIK